MHHFRVIHICYISLLSVRYYSPLRRAPMQIGLKTPLCLRDRLLLQNWFHREKRFTHLQLFVAKHVAISKLVWLRSHNDRRVMGPQLPPTVKVEPGLPNQLNLPITQTPRSVALKRWAWKCTKNQSRRWPAIGKG